MSLAAKRTKRPQKTNPHWRTLQGPPERLPKKNESSERSWPSEERARSWQPLTRRPTPEKLTLLEVMGDVWPFQDPRNDRLYRCEIGPDGGERWLSKVICTESELISQSDAARLIAVSRQAIRGAIVSQRLGTADCNGRPMVRRAEVLALQIDPNKRRRAPKQSRRTDQT